MICYRFASTAPNHPTGHFYYNLGIKEGYDGWLYISGNAGYFFSSYIIKVL